MTTILKNWHFMRVFRAGIAAWAFFEAYRTGEWIMILPGSLFAMQAIFDIGCCGSAGCGVPKSYASQDIARQETGEITAEEIR